MVVLYLRGIRDACYLSEVQKSQMQELLMNILQRRDFSSDNYKKTHMRIFEIVTAKHNEKLNEIARETAQLAKDMHALFGKHLKDVSTLAENVDADLANGVEPASLLAGLRDELKNVAMRMEMDNNALATLSQKDGLTGLDNRRSFDVFLRNAVETWQKDGAPLSLIMFDIDHFKIFNDTYGHLAGDQVLCTLAAQVLGILSRLEDDASNMLAARYGGEEFSVVLLGRAAAQAGSIAEQIRKTVEKTSLLLRDSENNVLERKLRVTVSVGVASASKDWPGAYETNLIDFADKCLYQAKRNGRNCTMQHQPKNKEQYVRLSP
jgi:diguanylate cyclase (GGDEF) domain